MGTEEQLHHVKILYANDYLQQQYQQQQGGIDDELDWFSKILLQFISQVLDQNNAWEWNLTYVAITTTVSLGCIRIICKKYYGIDWYAFLHALISSIGSFTCLYLNFITSQHLLSYSYTSSHYSDDDVAMSSLSNSNNNNSTTMTTMINIPEPLRSIHCYGPLTSLHRILPAITMGYSIYDFIDGLTISVDFVLHGFVTFTVMALFIYPPINAPHIMSPMLFMEGSTIFLTIIKATFFPNSIVLLNLLCFTCAFFLCRLVVVPYFWYQLIYTMYTERNHILYQQCFPPYFIYICFLFGMFYNILNTYWFIKIIKKARRKMLGIEKPTEANDLIDEADPSTKLSSSISFPNLPSLTKLNNNNDNNNKHKNNSSSPQKKTKIR